MDILYIAHYHELNGSIRSLLDLAEGLKCYGISPHFIVPRQGSFTRRLETLDMPFEILSIPWWMTKKSLSLGEKIQLARDTFKAARSVQKIAAQWNAELIYTNTSVIAVGRIAAILSNLPHVWHIRELAELHFSYQFFLPRTIVRRLIKTSDAVICHSQVVKQYLLDVDKIPTHLVYNGVATNSQFDIRLMQRQANQPAGVFTFIMLSDISPQKGQETAIQAMGSLKQKGVDAKLVLAGDGKPDYLQMLNQLVADLDINDRVEFTGFVSDPYPLYYAADCALICSEHEALSRVGLEAMSTALPLIGRNSGGNPEIILHGKTGFLYTTFDELVECMTRLVQYPFLGKDMGMAGWEMANERFNIEEYATGVYRVIQTVMKDRE